MLSRGDLALMQVMNRENRMRLRLLIAAYLAAWCMPAQAGIDKGTVDTSEYPFVVGLTMLNENGKEAAWCSGALMHKRIVLPSAHCFYNPITGAPLHLGSIQVNDGGVARIYAADVMTVRMSDVIRKELAAHEPGLMNKKYDVAVVTLRSEIDVEIPTTLYDIIPIEELSAADKTAQDLYRDKFWKKLVVENLHDHPLYSFSIIGYGHQHGCNDYACMDRKRRVKSMAIMDWTFCSDVWPPYYPATLDYWCSSPASAKGDSGGAVLAPYEGKKVLVGIVTAYLARTVADVYPSLFYTAKMVEEALQEIEQTPAVDARLIESPPQVSDSPEPAVPMVQPEPRRRPAQVPNRQYATINRNVSLGIHRMRTGPGTNHDIVAEVPAGSRVEFLGNCRWPTDGGQKKWCVIRWNGSTGWASSSGLVF